MQRRREKALNAIKKHLSPFNAYLVEHPVLPLTWTLVFDHKWQTLVCLNGELRTGVPWLTYLLMQLGEVKAYHQALVAKDQLSLLDGE